MISNTDITIVLSGGSSNTNPANSLGGVASLYPIGSNINNLFDDISPDEASSGYTDYRCIYVENGNATNSLFNTIISIPNQVSGGSVVQIGTTFRNEVQSLVIQGSPTGGYIVLNYEGNLSPHIVWNSNPSLFASNIQTELNNTTGLSDVVVSQGIINQFIITFAGDDGNRNQNILSVNTNAFTPSVSSPTISSITKGSPKNDIAGTISASTVAPNGVAFSIDSATIGTLRAEEGFPIWVARITSPGSDALADDGFDLLINGTVFQ